MEESALKLEYVLKALKSYNSDISPYQIIDEYAPLSTIFPTKQKLQRLQMRGEYFSIHF